MRIDVERVVTRFAALLGLYFSPGDGRNVRALMTALAEDVERAFTEWLQRTINEADPQLLEGWTVDNACARKLK